jgi:hypothetical protein
LAVLAARAKAPLARAARFAPLSLTVGVVGDRVNFRSFAALRMTG